MAVKFINDLNALLDYKKGDNDSYSKECNETIDHYQFYQFTLIPAFIITLLFAATKSRKNLFLNLLRGRPGLIYAMDSMTRTSRLSYACAFGATAFLVYKIVIERTYAIEYNQIRAVKTFVAIASMFIYGMVFYPLFSSLAVGSVFGFALGSLYVWMLTGVEIYRVSECELTQRVRILLVMRGLPSLLCMIFLCVSMPLRMGIAFRQKRYFYWDDEQAVSNTLKDVTTSYAGHHVSKLFRKPKIKPQPQNKKQKIATICMNLVHRFLYQRKRGFRYPSRIISVMLISLLVVYTLSFEILATIPGLVDMYEDIARTIVDDYLGPLDSEQEEGDVLYNIRLLCEVVLDFFSMSKICIIVANAVAVLLTVLNILHALASFRNNLFAVYKGDHSQIPPASTGSNTSHCINSIKYAGFQVAYIIWGFLLQFGTLSLIAFIIAVVSVVIVNGIDDWIIMILEFLWPIVVSMLFVMICQFLLAKFVFLQDRGAYLALNNRRLYFNFTYFMFFFNIFVGLVSCLIRIAKAMVVGIFFLSRLDNSTMPRRWEFIDPGFKAYVGFLHMEEAHTHPVLIVYSRLMLLALQTKREREAARQGIKAGADQASCRKIYPSEVRIQMSEGTSLTELDLMEDDAKRRRAVAARFNWHVAYTLLHNPDIRVFRKGYMQIMRQARLLGVSIPVSDRHGDVNIEKLQQSITDAKERSSKTPKADKKGAEAKNSSSKENVSITVEELECETLPQSRNSSVQLLPHQNGHTKPTA